MDQTPDRGSFRTTGCSANQSRPFPKKIAVFVRLVFAFLSGFLVWLNSSLLAVVGLTVGSAEDEDRVKGEITSPRLRQVAILSIQDHPQRRGVLQQNNSTTPRNDIAHGNLKAIVLRVNSPGGNISGHDTPSPPSQSRSRIPKKPSIHRRGAWAHSRPAAATSRCASATRPAPSSPSHYLELDRRDHSAPQPRPTYGTGHSGRRGTCGHPLKTMELRRGKQPDIFQQLVDGFTRFRRY